MKNRLSWNAARAVSLIGALALVGCGGDDGGGNGGPDASADAGDPGDAGVPDMGVDSGVPPVDPCPDNTEGCECISSATLQDFVVAQDTCEADLVCVPWDLASPRRDEFTGRFQSCVRPCTTDVECGAGRACVDNGFFTVESGLSRFCVDQTVGVDNFCGFSKLLNPQHPTLQIETGSQMIGCAGGHTCQLGFFGDVHPSEGICFDTCEDSTDCTMFTDTSTCNPRLFTTGSTTTPFIGICSSRVGQPGDLCGSGPNAEFSFTSACDTSNSPVNESACLFVNGLLDEGTGQCWSVCADPNEQQTVCPQDPALGNQACIPNLLVSGAGLCNVDCDAFGDACTGEGTNDLGRVCQTLVATINGVQTPFSQCSNRIGPALNPGVIGVDGRLVDAGDACDDPTGAGTNDVYRCPDPTFCAPVAPDGICLTGCQTSTAADVLSCVDITGSATSTCVAPDPQVLMDGLGFCSP